MDNVNFVAITGIVSGVSFNADAARKRPVIQMTAYSETIKKWTSQIYVIFSGDAMAKKSQGIKEGDILAVFGALSHDGTKVCIYCDSFISLIQNPTPVEEFYQRPTLLGFKVTPNKVFILGIVSQITGRLATIKTPSPPSVEGEISSHLYAPIILPENTDIELGDEILFAGSFSDEGVIGDARTLKKNPKNKMEDFK